MVIIKLSCSTQPEIWRVINKHGTSPIPHFPSQIFTEDERERERIKEEEERAFLDPKGKITEKIER